MVIFYTIGLPDSDDYKQMPDQFYQVIYSVYTIRLKWPHSIPIIIYTNNMQMFTKLFNLNKMLYSNIFFREAPDEYKRFTYYYSPYGHMRNFLAYDLLQEFNDIIIYLDPDTGVRESANPESFKYFEKLKTICLYRPEPYNPFKFWSGHTLNEIIDFESELKIPNTSCAINNGVMVIPPTKKSENDLFYLRDVYDYVYTKTRLAIDVGTLGFKDYDICFADMFSASIVYWQRAWGTLYDAKFFNIHVISEGKIIDDNPEVPILHYYNAKHNDPPSKWEIARDKIKAVMAGL